MDITSGDNIVMLLNEYSRKLIFKVRDFYIMKIIHFFTSALLIELAA